MATIATSSPTPFLTLLSGGKAPGLVIVWTDFVIFVSKDNPNVYSPITTFLVWVATVVLCFSIHFAPASHRVAVVASACFVIVRLVLPLHLPSHRRSFFLSVGGHHLFHKRPWVHDHILYLDRPSAFLTGLISYRSDKRLVNVFDIKTWHFVALDVRDESSFKCLSAFDRARLHGAVPMIE
ncbi:Aste57867_12304 [Aphanomyces stellatus]|uniref:Aste57867_12304 protein n=1 Tax=Aphanomyces stellatus TaxID=120398 RepID=A0A485KVU2_9STRA|nr:hypothetical protein As57867_012258 [Aphanomyces stellatus]VFT89156.1 Aste57867_12304 [Aphanomyces stellatus]